jgi:hypothetical protein
MTNPYKKFSQQQKITDEAIAAVKRLRQREI